MMKVGIDIQALQTEATRHRGIGRYTLSLIEALKNCQDGNIYQLFANNALAVPELDTDYLSYKYLNYVQGENKELNDLSMKASLVSEDIESLLIANPMEGDDIVMPNFANYSKSYFVICYDLIPLIFSDKYLGNPRRKEHYLSRLENIKHADFVFTISEATRQDAIKYLNIPSEKALNISAGFSPIFTPLQFLEHRKWLKEFANKFGVDKKFILYTGGEDWRKNIEGMVHAFAQLPQNLKDNYQLVIACKVSEQFSQKITKLASDLGIKKSLVLTNYVTDQELRALYSTCSLFVFPSFYEGFGLPLLEAMACGAPAIASNSSSLVEIISDSKLLFNPHSTKEITNKMQQVLSDQAWSKKISEIGQKRATQFSWQSVANKMSNVFKEYKPINRVSVSFARITTEETKTKIAFFSPFRPIKSGISDYSHELLTFLANHCELDLYYDEGYSPDTTDLNQAVFPWSQFEKRVVNEDYENIIYHIGNSDYH